MCEKINKLLRSKNEISQILNMATKFQTEINKKHNVIKLLKDRVEGLEQYTKEENQQWSSDHQWCDVLRPCYIKECYGGSNG